MLAKMDLVRRRTPDAVALANQALEIFRGAQELIDALSESVIKVETVVENVDVHASCIQRHFRDHRARKLSKAVHESELDQLHVATPEPEPEQRTLATIKELRAVWEQTNALLTKEPMNEVCKRLHWDVEQALLQRLTELEEEEVLTTDRDAAHAQQAKNAQKAVECAQREAEDKRQTLQRLELRLGTEAKARASADARAAQLESLLRTTQEEARANSPRLATSTEAQERTVKLTGSHKGGFGVGLKISQTVDDDDQVWTSVVVDRIESGGPAFDAGVQIGMHLVRAAGVEVSAMGMQGLQQLMNTMKENETQEYEWEFSGDGNLDPLQELYQMKAEMQAALASATEIDERHQMEEAIKEVQLHIEEMKYAEPEDEPRAEAEQDMSPYDSVNHAALKVQRAWRKYYMRSCYRFGLEALLVHAVVIQKHWRGHITREYLALGQELLESLADRNISANSAHSSSVKLQSSWRGHVARRNTVNPERARAASVTLQSNWRGHTARRAEQTNGASFKVVVGQDLVCVRKTLVRHGCAKDSEKLGFAQPGDVIKVESKEYVGGVLRLQTDLPGWVTFCSDAGVEFFSELSEDMASTGN